MADTPELEMHIVGVDGSVVTVPCEPGATPEMAQDGSIELLKLANFSLIIDEVRRPGYVAKAVHTFNSANIVRIYVSEKP